MAIFGKSKESVNALVSVNHVGGVSLIAEGTTIKGNVTTMSGIQIEGTFEGEIQSEATVMIGEKGKGQGIVKSAKMAVNGLFEGESECNAVEILAQGVYKGELVADELVIERGGSFIGNSRLKNQA